MKTINVIFSIGYIFLLVAMFTSCEIETELEGNGEVTTKRQLVQEFDELSIDGVLNVYYAQADSYKAEVKTDENLHGIVNIENVNGKLKVYTDTDDEFDATCMDVYIWAPNVSKIVLDGVTALYFENKMEQNALVIEKHNTGYMYFNGTLRFLTIVTDGIGDMELVGESENMTIDNNMIGDIKAYDFEVDFLTLFQGGAGTVQVNVKSQIDVELLGVGDVYCKGAPTDVLESGAGLGRLYVVAE